MMFRVAEAAYLMFADILGYTIEPPGIDVSRVQTLGHPLHIYVVDPNPSYTEPPNTGTVISKLKITLKGTYVDRAPTREHNVSLTLDKYTYVNES